MTKLYDVPNNTYVRVLPNEDDDEIRIPPAAPVIEVDDRILFGHIDGMYSYCTNSKGELVHLAAWQEVKICDD